MKTIIQSTIAVAAVCLLAGCETTGLSPRENSGASYPNYILSLQSNPSNAVPKKIIRPIRLAVAQVGETAPPDTMLNKLAGQKMLVASVVGLPLPGDGENNFYNNQNRQNEPDEKYAARIKAVRGLARAAGADYVFLFGGNIDSWEKSNPLTLFDLTIIGGALIPGTEIKMEGKSAGALIDVATGEPVLFVNADTKDSAASPDYLVDGRTSDLRAHVRDALIEKLGDQLLKKLAE